MHCQCKCGNVLKSENAVLIKCLVDQVRKSVGLHLESKKFDQADKTIAPPSSIKCQPLRILYRSFSFVAILEFCYFRDFQDMKTTARHDGEDWILNGSKVFISHGHIADLIVVAAITNKEAKSPAHGMSLFLLDSGTPGFTRGRRLDADGFIKQVLIIMM